MGNSGVGKSFLLTRYAKGCIPSVSLPTIGIDYAIKQIKTKRGNEYKV